MDSARVPYELPRSTPAPAVAMPSVLPVVAGLVEVLVAERDRPPGALPKEPLRELIDLTKLDVAVVGCGSCDGPLLRGVDKGSPVSLSLGSGRHVGVGLPEGGP